MEFVKLEDFLDDVMPEISGCTEFAAEDRIRRAAIELCRESMISQETTEELDLEANERILEIPALSNDVLMHRILWMKNTKTFMHLYNRRHLAERNIVWDAPGTTDYPGSYVQKSRTEIELIPAPRLDKSGEINVHCAYIPSKNAKRLDAVLIDEYRDAIASGALSRLLMMSGEAWYNPKAAAINEAQFRHYISKAIAAVNKDKTVVNDRVQLIPFA